MVVAAAIAALVNMPLSVIALSGTAVSPLTGTTTGGNIVFIKGAGFTTEKQEKFIDVAAGVNHALLLSSSGHVWSLGSNKYGQLGTGQSRLTSVIKPVDITDLFKLSPGDTIKKVAAGDYYSMALSTSGRVFTWGRNKNGQLGIGFISESADKPVDITTKFGLDSDDAIRIIGGSVDTSYAVSNKGQVFTWGYADHYMDGVSVGSGIAPQTTPRNITELTSAQGGLIVDMSIGNRSAIALLHTSQDIVLTWGSNQYGQLGTSSGLGKYSAATFIMPSKFNLKSDDEIVDVEAGNGVDAVLTKYGRVFIWGNDAGGMLGVGGEPSDLDHPDNRWAAQPVEITQNFALPESGDTIEQISIGNSQVIARSSYGYVYTWGANSYGQLGTGNTLGSGEITDITKQFNLAKDVTIDKVLAAGKSDESVSSYSYAVDSNGAVYAWGGDRIAKPGINAITNQLTPTIISSRLTAEVPNVAEVRVGDKTVEDFAVLDDRTIRMSMPPADMEGEVAITVTDLNGNTVTLPQKYTYTQPKEPDNPDTPNTPDGNDKNTDSSDKDNDSLDDKPDNDKTDEDGQNQLSPNNKLQADNKDNMDGSKLKNDKDALNLESPSTGSGGKAKIVAPNTGLAL